MELSIDKFNNTSGQLDNVKHIKKDDNIKQIFKLTTKRPFIVNIGGTDSPKQVSFYLKYDIDSKAIGKTIESIDLCRTCRRNMSKQAALLGPDGFALDLTLNCAIKDPKILKIFESIKMARKNDVCCDSGAKNMTDIMILTEESMREMNYWTNRGLGCQYDINEDSYEPKIDRHIGLSFDEDQMINWTTSESILSKFSPQILNNFKNNQLDRRIKAILDLDETFDQVMVDKIKNSFSEEKDHEIKDEQTYIKKPIEILEKAIKYKSLNNSSTYWDYRVKYCRDLIDFVRDMSNNTIWTQLDEVSKWKTRVFALFYGSSFTRGCDATNLCFKSSKIIIGIMSSTIKSIKGVFSTKKRKRTWKFTNLISLMNSITKSDKYGIKDSLRQHKSAVKDHRFYCDIIYPALMDFRGIIRFKDKSYIKFFCDRSYDTCWSLYDWKMVNNNGSEVNFMYYRIDENIEHTKIIFMDHVPEDYELYLDFKMCQYLSEEQQKQFENGFGYEIETKINESCIKEKFNHKKVEKAPKSWHSYRVFHDVSWDIKDFELIKVFNVTQNQIDDINHVNIFQNLTKSQAKKMPKSLPSFTDLLSDHKVEFCPLIDDQVIPLTVDVFDHKQSLHLYLKRLNDLIEYTLNDRIVKYKQTLKNHRLKMSELIEITSSKLMNVKVSINVMLYYPVYLTRHNCWDTILRNQFLVNVITKRGAPAKLVNSDEEEYPQTTYKWNIRGYGNIKDLVYCYPVTESRGLYKGYYAKFNIYPNAIPENVSAGMYACDLKKEYFEYAQIWELFHHGKLEIEGHKYSDCGIFFHSGKEYDIFINNSKKKLIID